MRTQSVAPKGSIKEETESSKEDDDNGNNDG